MVDLISQFIPLSVLLSHFLLAFVILAFIFRKSWGGGAINFVRAHALVIGFTLSLFIVLGSMFYSSVLGYPPCELCWWQRILLFPSLILFIVALKNKDNKVFSYVLPLALLAGVISVYQIYAQMGGTSILDCTAVGGDCLKVYVDAFGFITIPVMGLTSAVSLSLLSFIAKKND